MKVLLYSDVHWSSVSSLVTMRGNLYTYRLEQLIKSMNWLQNLCTETNCEVQICLGDFFDKSTVTDEEISALTDIHWAACPKYFLVGNHESAQNDLRFNTTNELSMSANPCVIVEKPYKINIGSCTVYFIPYILESNRAPLKTILTDIDKAYPSVQTLTNKMIVSHNDIAGQNYAGFISKVGFSIDEIEDVGVFFLNGHLHNQQQVSQHILNIGSVSAHNFTNDSTVYKYGAWIFDTDTLQLTFVENPYSLQFYKIDVLEQADLQKLQKLKANAVLSIRCHSALKESVQQALQQPAGQIIANRIVTIATENTAPTKETIQELRHNHLEKLVEFCTQNIGNTEILEAELAEICK